MVFGILKVLLWAVPTAILVQIVEERLEVYQVILMKDLPQSPEELGHE